MPSQSEWSELPNARLTLVMGRLFSACNSTFDDGDDGDDDDVDYDDNNDDDDVDYDDNDDDDFGYSAPLSTCNSTFNQTTTSTCLHPNPR